MSRRQFDLYAVERRVGHILFIAGLALVKYGVLAKYRTGDVLTRARVTRNTIRLGRAK